LEDLAVVLLAAGQGTRMKSDLLKVLHPVCGRPMIEYALDRVEALRPSRRIVVVGYQADRVRELLGDRVEYAHQEEQLGTAHAVLMCEPLLEGHDGPVVVLYGDTPLLSEDDLQELVRTHRLEGNRATVLTVEFEDPSGYGRVIRKGDGRFDAVVEEPDAGPEELKVREINTGIYCFDASSLFRALKRVSPDNRQNEYYIVDALSLIEREGGRVGLVRCADPSSVSGVNDRFELAQVERIVRMRILARLMKDGVTVEDPDSTYVHAGVEIGRDTVLRPGTIVEGTSRIGSACVLGPRAHIVDSTISDGTRISESVVEESRVGSNVAIGPFAHLRPGTVIEDGARVGNFAELKNSRVGGGSKVPHHSYVGDADVGSGVNIGAGVVTVNYDGRRKHRTVIDDGAFVGCNSNLIAPVRVGPSAYIAAGSSITEDVPPGALAIARARQANREGWVERRMRGAEGGGDDDREGDG